jgi:hypothetical protein
MAVAKPHFFCWQISTPIASSNHPRQQNDQTLQPMTRELGTKPPTQDGNNSIPAGQTLQPMTQELGTKPPTQDGKQIIPRKIRGQRLPRTSQTNQKSEVGKLKFAFFYIR